MILGKNLAAARPSRIERHIENFEGFRTELIVSPEHDEQVSPQAFLVEQNPHFTLRTHYHLQHQFQVVVGGSGTLGRHRLEPFVLHYASVESGYGPIVAGPDGLAYLTLRAVSDTGAWYLPEARGRMRRGLAKSQCTAEPPRLSGPAEMRARSAPEIEDLIVLQPGGLAAWFVRLPPAASLTLPDAHSGAGRFHVVSTGTMMAESDAHEALGVVFVSADQPQFEIRAGDDGLEVLVVQFPHEALPRLPGHVGREPARAD